MENVWKKQCLCKKVKKFENRFKCVNSFKNSNLRRLIFKKKYNIYKYIYDSMRRKHLVGVSTSKEGALLA